MHARRMTRPVKMITLMGVGSTTQMAVTSELAPLSERWRRTGEQLSRVRLALVEAAGWIGRGLRLAWDTVHQLFIRSFRVTGPRIASALTDTGHLVRRNLRGVARTIRRVRGRIRRRHRRRDLVPTNSSNEELLQTLDRLTWEVQSLQDQIRAQQDILIRIASQQSAQDVDIAWVAHVIGSARQPSDESPQQAKNARVGYHRPALTQLGSLQKLCE